jgi:hypothetical protein
MSSSGATYYDEELKYLYPLLKNLPDVILEGNAHDFTNYVRHNVAVLQGSVVGQTCAGR